ncbi:hypothetical protein J4225_01355 [Candidatus Pacearchaeota archaeon]|nr:hypothetical protein [Candidatus Pacearchaeota archaeon]
MKSNNYQRGKRGQITLFIIIAIIIVSLVVGVFLLKDVIFQKRLPASLEPVYNTFLSCLEQDTLTGIDVLESQAGYIYLPNFDTGSEYMPFSSQLNVLGNPVPYWYYVSGNNFQKEQVPSKTEMEQQLADFIESKVSACVFDDYYEQGYDIIMQEPEAKVSISDKSIMVNLDMLMEISKAEETAKVSSHEINVNSKLGELYKAALEVYNHEQDTLFLETYGVDVLRLYAPVDGVEITCAPKIWDAEKVFDELENAIEANTLALKVKGGDVQEKADDYFMVDISPKANVRFLTSKNWPHSFEVDPSEESILIASPVGDQPGLGILGFCYVPYHFVYNVNYPVLIQVYDEAVSEIFQFPVAVVIQGNKQREALEGSGAIVGLPELCQHKNTQVSVNTYDLGINPVDAKISFECFGTKCSIGETENGQLSENFPQCVNGYILADAEGYRQGKTLFSTTESGATELFLEKVYELDLNLRLDGRTYTGQAIVNFVSEKYSTSVVYPEQKSVKLSEGDYEIIVQIYRDSQLKLEATSKSQCIDVPNPGLGGILGMTTEKCFDINIPEQTVTNALSGGGSQPYYFVESELAGGRLVEIDATSLPIPSTLEQLQSNQLLFEQNSLIVNVR